MVGPRDRGLDGVPNASTSLSIVKMGSTTSLVLDLPPCNKQSDPTCLQRIVVLNSLCLGRKAIVLGKCNADAFPLGGRKCVRPLMDLVHGWPYLSRFSYTSYRHTLGCPEPERTTQIINEPFGALTTVIALALIGCLRKCSCQVRRLELA